MNATPRTNARTTSGISDLVWNLAGIDIQMGQYHADRFHTRCSRALCGVVAEGETRAWKCYRIWPCTFTRIGKTNPIGGGIIGNMAETATQARTNGKQRANDYVTSWLIWRSDGSFQIWNSVGWTCQTTADFHASSRPLLSGPRTVSEWGTR